MLWTLFEIALNLLEGAYFLSIMLKHNKTKPWVTSKKVFGYYIFMVAMFCFINFSTDNSLISGYLFFLLLLLFNVFFLEGSFANRLFWLAFPFTIVICTDVSTIMFTMNFLSVPLEVLLSPGISRIIVAFVTKTTMVFAWKVLISLELSEYDTIPYRRITIISLIIPFVLFSLILFTNATDKTGVDFLKILAEALMFSLACLSFLIYMSYRSFAQSKRKYAASVIEAYTKARNFRLELLKELQPLWALRYDKELLATPKYRTAFEAMDKLSKGELRTGNDFADAIILVHEAEAFDSGTFLNVSGSFSVNDTVKTSDICLVLEHLLSTAVKKMQILMEEDVSKVITLSILDKQGELVFLLENPSWVEDHGFDLSPIEDIVRKYNGNSSSSTVDLYRTTSVYLSYPDIGSV